MALKAKITKEELAKLPDAIKSEYIEDGDGYRLDVDGAEDTGALKRAKDREKQLRQDAEAKLRELEDAAAAANEGKAKEKGDIDALEKKWKADLQAEKDAHAATTTKFQNNFKKTMIDAAADAMASKISTVPSLVSRAIKDRLTVDFEGDTPVTRVIGADGKVSDMTVDDLQKEMVANPDYKNIMIASKASGGAGNPTNKGGGAPTFDGQHQTEKPADFSKMNAKDLAAHITAKKEAASET